MLLEHPGQVVTREELRDRLWPRDTFVDFDHSLNTAIMRLRDALGDSSENPVFVETLPRRGYRFIAPVDSVVVPEWESHSPASHEMTPQVGDTPVEIAARWSASSGHAAAALRGRWAPLRRNLILAGVVAVGVLAVIALTLRGVRGTSSGKAGAGQIASLVVLPLENLSGDRDQEYFADGMTDELTASLAKIAALRVISRSSAMAYKGTRKPLGQIARELNVDAVVEGTVLRSANRVRITAELVEAPTDRHLWADTYESDLGDILTVQSQVARTIANEIRIKLTPEDQFRLARARPVNTEAYESYLKGRYFWNRRSEEGLNRAIEYFQQAIEKDPQYALAYAGLADCYGLTATTIVGSVPSTEAAPRTKAAALKALEIDDSLAAAHTTLATMRFNYDWDWLAAESGFHRALELDPSYATAHQRYSLYLMAMGRTKDSLAEINRARELDPLSMSINFSLGWRLYLGRQYDQAIEQLRNTIEMDPSFLLTHVVLGQAYEQKQEYSRAIAELQKAMALSPESAMIHGALGRAFAVAGKNQEARNELAELVRLSRRHYVSPFYVALVHAGLGEKDEAINWLDKAFQDRSNGLVFLKMDPELDSLRTLPRFQALLRRMEFPE
jgi:TolB-like protein/DNA-binding winged helix-turn-helix (wHTH) protein/Tfp pilus assembly protein PilF